MLLYQTTEQHWAASVSEMVKLLFLVRCAVAQCQGKDLWCVDTLLFTLHVIKHFPIYSP